MEQENRQLIIIGSGPAGLTAAIYAARANLSPLVLAGIEFGGQLMTTTLVENYPGFPDGIDGPELMAQMIKQAEKFGAQIVYEKAEQVNFSDRPFQVTTNNQTYRSDAVIVAVGAAPKKLGLASETKYWGKGVSSCATCDGALYRDKVVAVVGGGDSAMEEALFLTHFAQKVYLVHRRSELRASKIMQDRVRQNQKIELILNSEIVDVLGDEFVTGIKLTNVNDQSTNDLSVDGLFLAIGHLPMTTFLAGGLELDAEGYVQTSDGVHTNIEGVFVAGDAADHTYRQAITAAGMGCKAAIEAERWLAVR